MSRAPSLFLEGAAHFGGAAVFQDLRLEVPGGEWTCLLGPSGVGKTTVLRLFAGLETGVAFDGTCSAGDGAPLAGRVALMSQDDLLLPWLDAVANTAIGARLRGDAPDIARAREILARVGLSGHLQKLPAEMSGGQRQRVALARVLFEDRAIVLLDEPFSALDAGTRAGMQDLAAEVLSGRTVLHVTHDAAEAARLGRHIQVMFADGLTPIPAPESAVPRAVDARETLDLQAQLLRRLMESA